MEPLDTITYHDYRIEIVADQDAENPLTDCGAPTLVLHSNAEQHFGWTTDKGWQAALEEAPEQILERGVTRNLYGPGGALEIVSRWLRIFYGIPVVLPAAAIEHSGTAVYLGAGAHWCDPGGYDSGWIGWWFATKEQLTEWGCELTGDELEKNLTGCFAEFEAWVSGDVVGYRIYDPDDVEVESVYGIYGSDAFKEPDGWALAECRAVIDQDSASREHQLELELTA